MAKKESIDDLYISLGLDVSSLQVDFATADKTVKQGLAELQRKQTNLKIKTDIDLAKFDGNATKQYEIQLKSLNEQLAIQKTRIQLANAALQDTVNKTGATSIASQKMQTNLLKEQREYAKLDAAVKKLNSTMVSPAADKHINNMAKVKGSLSSLSSSYGLVTGKMAALMGVMATGAGLFNITESAMKSGEALYQLSKRLGTSTSEAAGLKRIFDIAGTDIQSITPFLARLDKQILQSGVDGNATTESLKRFGITLTDQQGNLLGVNEQLKQLAQGYQNAAAAGETESFTAEILGARGAGLIPILEEYNDLIEIASRVRTTGLLNPKEAHELYIEWKVMSTEAGQLKSALGAALVPIALDIMPSISNSFAKLVDVIKENKDSIRDFAEFTIAMLDAVGGAIGKVASAADSIGVNFGNMTDFVKRAEWFDQKDKGFFETLEAFSGIGYFSNVAASYFGDSNKEYHEWLEKQKNAANNKPAATQADKVQPNKTSIPKASKEIEEANKELNDKLYQLTHNQLENQLYAIETEKKAWLKKGVDEANATKLAEAQKAKIIEEFNDNTLSKINSVYKSALQNRLDDIEREKRAWKQKGVDEVESTKWAEHEKRVAMQNEALEAYKSQRKYIEMVKEIMSGTSTVIDEHTGAKIITKTSNLSPEQQQAAINQRALQMFRKDNGITNADYTTPAQMLAFSQAMKFAKENAIPGLEVGNFGGAVNNQTAKQQTQVVNNNYTTPTITVNIDSPTVTDSAFISSLAEKTADVITPVIQAKFSNSNLSY